LYIGIILSFVLRAIFIVAGVAAISAATAAFFVFGALLVYTGVRLLFEGENDDADFREGWVLTRLRRVLPLSTEYEGDRILVRREGRRMATPLALTIAAIAVANVVFALDSIPAILGLTQDTYIILTANAFALMGLRQLFFVIGGLLDRLTYLNIGLALILCFVGLKLVDEGFRGEHRYHLGSVPIPEISTGASLGFIVGVLAITAIASLIRSSTTPPDAA
jgi:tellurite resistance protein TerC